MTERKITARDVERALAMDRRIIAALADVAEAKFNPRPQRLEMRKTTPTPTKAPAKKTPAKPIKKETADMKIKPRTKTTTAKHRRPVTPEPKSGVRIEIPSDALLPPETWSLPTVSRARKIQQSVHEVEDVTPCHTCKGPCDPKEDTWGPWRRHRECLTVTQPWQRITAAAVHFGIDITSDEAVAAQATIFVDDYADEHAANRYTEDDRDRTPWAHVDRKALARAVVTARQALAAIDEPGQCDMGVCGWCGREKSISWSDYGHMRQDGTSAPLCASCAPNFDKLPGLPVDRWTDQKPGISEAMTGVSPDILEVVPVALKAHAELGGGDGTPWSHLPVEAVEAYRWEVWGRYGGTHAPEEHRAEAVARAEAQEADRGARLHAQETADPYGFSDTEGHRD